MKHIKTVSVIIPSYNRSHILPKTIPSFYQEGVKEIIIVDDQSTDNTRDVVIKIKEEIPIVRYLKAPFKGYQMGAKNLGIENATGDYCLFGDDDCILKPKSIPHMLEIIENNPESIVGARHLVLSKMEDLEEILADKNTFHFESIDDIIDSKAIKIYSEKKYDQILNVPFCMQTFMLPTKIAKQQKFWSGYKGTCNREETDYQMQICNKFGMKILLDNEALAIDAPRNVSSGGIRSVKFLRRQFWEIYNEYNFWRRNKKYLSTFTKSFHNEYIATFRMFLKKLHII